MVDPLSTAAVGWGFSAACWLISPILTRFLNKCFDALDVDPFGSKKRDLLAKLEKLQTNLLPKLLILTDAAEKSEHRNVLKLWLQQLKFAFYEAEHVLGLVEYRRLEKKVNSLFPCNSKFNLNKLKNKLKFSSEKNELIKSLENLEKLVNEGMEFVGLLSLPKSNVNNPTGRPNIWHRETSSTSNSKVIGRDEDRDEIVKLLRESSSNAKCYSVVGLWGMGGSGKTTLARYVCEYEKEAKYFDLVIWAGACFSDI